MQASTQVPYHRIQLDESFSHNGPLQQCTVSPTMEARIVKPEEEIALAAGAWLWDYARRCQQAGLFLPLSGGVDSCATAVIVYSMARMVCTAIKERNVQVTNDLRRMCGEPQESKWEPSTPQEICNRIFHTCFMGTENSSSETRQRAKSLAKDIGAFHIDLNMDAIVKGFTTLFTGLFNRSLRFRSQGGTNQEGLALQNIQSRSRMVLAYFLASTLTIVRGRAGGGSLLVLGSANVDVSVRFHCALSINQQHCSSLVKFCVSFSLSTRPLPRFGIWIGAGHCSHYRRTDENHT